MGRNPQVDSISPLSDMEQSGVVRTKGRPLLSTVFKTEPEQNGEGNNNPDYLLLDAAERLAVNRLFYKEVSCAE